jgi:ribokinase
LCPDLFIATLRRYLRRNSLSAQKPIVVVGSINTDLVAVTRRIPVIGETVIGSDFQIHPGGKGANQAVAIARLGYPVRLIGRLGNDTFGSELRTSLEAAGVDISGVSTSHGASGVAVIAVSERGENSIIIAPGANSRVTPADIDANISVLRGAGLVLAQLEIPLDTVEHLARVCPLPLANFRRASSTTSRGLRRTRRKWLSISGIEFPDRSRRPLQR